MIGINSESGKYSSGILRNNKSTNSHDGLADI